MIIAFTQKKEGLDISYVDENNQIAVEEIILDNGYYNYVECDKFDPNVIPDFKSFKGSHIKKESSKYFTHHNINEFFCNDIPNLFGKQFEKFNKLAEPNPFSVDIETDITDEFGYSDQHRVENSIRSIAITDKNLQSILFIVKNPKHPVINDLDMGYINSIIQESLKQHYSKYDFGTSVRIFDTEVEMLQVFIECINKHFHLIIGWNVLGYDWLYIYNRCEKLNIDIKKASPTRRLSSEKIKINAATSIEVKIPTHRIITCYMNLFQKSLIYNNLGSYSLDNISEIVLGLNKVSYNGNLRTLYEEDYLRFVAYGFMDTILVMLIHKITNLLTVDFFQSFYTGIPYQSLSQNSISEALVYQELRSENKFLLESEKSNLPKRDYQGGYVKTKTKKIVESVIGEDFKALYPNAMIAMGLSPEAKIDEIKMSGEFITNKDKKQIWFSTGFPLNEVENKKWLKYKELGYSLSPMGRIYDVSKDFLYTRIEKKLLEQRGIFQGHMSDIYLHIIPKLKEELKKRKNNL